ncbi:helix-turn-helix domain-containing protein [Aeromicrobium sp. CTD01-1L150]|uniref:helix-turn-helix domain-containing protein n=1 Tax=Aeromicrobium sp. CTD01-1L150 TaxID=3341830 RepID=UPI0035C21348
MDISTSADLGALVKEHRIEQGLTQAALAERAGVGRKLLVRLEQGRPSLEVGRVLSVLEALGVSLTADRASPRESKNGARSLIDSVFESLHEEEDDHH